MRELRLATSQTVHAAAVKELDPDTEYRYELRSGGAAIPQSIANPGTFRTLPLLEGKRLATIAVVNDMHVGEHCSGTITEVNGESFPPCFTGDDYAWRMTRAATEEVRRLKPDLVVANGDLTDRGRPDEVRRALELLRGTGRPLQVTRGNHDRRYHTPDQACGEDGDCLRREAFPERAPGDHALTSVARVGKRVAVVGLDSCDPESGEGRLDLGGQLEWLDRVLRELRAEGRILRDVPPPHRDAVQRESPAAPLLRRGRDERRARRAARDRQPRCAARAARPHPPQLPRARPACTQDVVPRERGDQGVPGRVCAAPRARGRHRAHVPPPGRSVLPRVDAHFSRADLGMAARYTRGSLPSRSFALRFDGSGGSGAPAPSIYGPVACPRVCRYRSRRESRARGAMCWASPCARWAACFRSDGGSFLLPFAGIITRFFGGRRT